MTKQRYRTELGMTKDGEPMVTFVPDPDGKWMRADEPPAVQTDEKGRPMTYWGGMASEPSCYSGPIEVGMEFDWEKYRFHAHCRVRVTELQPRRVKAEVLSGQAIIGSQWWNDEDRFREACIPVRTGG